MTGNKSKEKIKYLMAVRDWDYEDLSRALTVVRKKKVTKAHAGKLVRSKNKTSKTANDIAKALGCNLSDIYTPLY